MTRSSVRRAGGEMSRCSLTHHIQVSVPRRMTRTCLPIVTIYMLLTTMSFLYISVLLDRQPIDGQQVVSANRRDPADQDVTRATVGSDVIQQLLDHLGGRNTSAKMPSSKGRQGTTAPSNRPVDSIPKGWWRPVPLNITPPLSLLVFSAYLDLRQTTPNPLKTVINATAFVRIIASLKTTHVVRTMARLRCSVKSGGKRRNWTKLWDYKMTEDHRKPHAGFILNCPLYQDDMDTSNMTVLLGEQEGNVTRVLITLPVYSPSTNTSPQWQYALCVPPLFGSAIAEVRLVEFLEMVALLGVDHVTIYLSVHTDTARTHLDRYLDRYRQVLHYYTHQRALVEVVEWNSPWDKDKSTAIWYQGQMPAIQDCLYRNMYRTKYLLFHDIDELMVPDFTTSGTQLSHVIPDMWDYRNNVSGYQVGVGYYWTDNIKLPHTIHSVEMARDFGFVRTKPIVLPHLIFEMGIHHISRPVDGQVTRRAPMDVLLLHHLTSKCKLGTFKETGNCTEYVIHPDMPARYGEELVENMMITLEKLNLSSLAAEQRVSWKVPQFPLPLEREIRCVYGKRNYRWCQVRGLLVKTRRTKKVQGSFVRV